MVFKPTLAVNAVLDKIKYPVYASPKLDGIRCSIVNGRALSRTLKPIPNYLINFELSQPNLTGLDGELIVGSPTSKTCYTDTVSNVMAFATTPTYTYYVFDLHNRGDEFSRRHAALCSYVRGLHEVEGTPHIQLLEQIIIYEEDDMLAYEATKVEEGYEGIILRSPNAPYKFGRSTVNEGYLLKLKRFEDGEAEVIGFEEEMFNGNEAQTNELGRTKRSTSAAGLCGKGTLGAFLVRDVVTGVEFSIGTGLTAAARQSAWDNRGRLLGTLRKYKFFPVGVKDRPRHPVDLGPRYPEDMT